MLSRFHSADKSSSKKKPDCACASIKLDDRRNGDQMPPIVDIECSSHPGFCVLDDNGLCTKRENAVHCAEVPLKSLGETLQVQEREGDGSDSKSARQTYNKKVHCFKVDLNNSEDTGLIMDKQCQTCGPECGPKTCSSRSRAFFISWDKIRTKLFLSLVFVFVLWLSVYTTLSLTSNL